jgi:hypothetical protein
MLSTGVAALAGAGGLGAVLTPVLVHLTARRVAAQTENSALINELQEERNVIRVELAAVARERAVLWDYVLRLRYSIVKGDEPPTMPDTLTIAAVRAHLPAPRPEGIPA